MQTDNLNQTLKVYKEISNLLDLSLANDLNRCLIDAVYVFVKVSYLFRAIDRFS